MNVDGRVKVCGWGWKRERARSRLRGWTVLIPSPESGRVDLGGRQNFDTGNGHSTRYDLSVRVSPFLSGGPYSLLAQPSELGQPSSGLMIGTFVLFLSYITGYLFSLPYPRIPYFTFV
jgi:hypothetical protein